VSIYNYIVFVLSAATSEQQNPGALIVTVLSSKMKRRRTRLTYRQTDRQWTTELWHIDCDRFEWQDEL